MLLTHLAKHGYHPCKNIHGLFTHATRPIAFSLVVDDFGVKYGRKENTDHLYNTLKAKYTVTADWAGDLFLGMKLDWNYEKGHINLSMPGYIAKALQRFNVAPPTKPEHAPHRHTEPQHGAAIQYTELDDDTVPLNPSDTKNLQEIIGTFFYYVRAVDNTMLTAFSTLVTAQAKGTQ